jgi:DNA-directed RNA polymerase specialized sigma24 family protein
MTNQEIFANLKQTGTPIYERTVSFVWETYGGKIIGMVKSKGGSEEDGYDILSESIMKLIEKIVAGVYTQKDNFFGLLYTIAFNNCMNMFRKRKSKSSPYQNWDELTDKELKAMEDDRTQIISYLFHKGPYFSLDLVSDVWELWGHPRCKQRYYQLIVEGKSRQDLAQEEMVTEKNMDTILSRCRKKFRAFVAELSKQTGN